MTVRFYSSTAAETTLTASITSGNTSIQVGSVTGFPVLTPYTLALDYESATEELVEVTSAAGTTLTVTRAIDSTSAAAHNAGARVRHVSSARDFSDSRSHENATSGVHGVTGTIVGTTDTQTLSNKTLSNPTIDAATLTGTFTGTPTLSGAVLFTGNPVFQGAAASNIASSHRVAGDSTPRLQAQADGRLLWGSGSAAADVALYRDAVDVLGIDDALRFTRAAATGDAIHARVTGDAGIRYLVEVSGVTGWGDGSSFTLDTNLFRSAAGTLRTDGAFIAGTSVTAATMNATTSIVSPDASLDDITTFGITHASGIPYKPTQTDNVSLSFGPATSFTQAVVFDTAFGVAPNVHTNINSGVAATASWGSRAISVSTTGFTLFVFGPSATWSAVDVQWTAVSK